MPKGRDGRRLEDLSFAQQLLGGQNPDSILTVVLEGAEASWSRSRECSRVMLNRQCVYSPCQRGYLSENIGNAFALNARGRRFQSPVRVVGM